MGRSAWATAEGSHGRIIGVVDLVDVHVGGEWEDDHCFRAPAPGEPEVISMPRCSPWAQTSTYHLVLENPRALATPIPYTGALGLRELDEKVELEIRQQVCLDEHDIRCCAPCRFHHPTWACSDE